MKGRAALPMRRAVFFLSALVAVAVLAVLAGTLLPRPLFHQVTEGTVSVAEPARRVLVLSNQIHSDIALPADTDVLERFAFLREDGLTVDLAGVEWLVFGWGGRSFYLETPTWSDLKAGPAFRALTLDRAVMHVSLAGAIDQKQGNVLAIDLAAENFERLMTGIEAGFAAGDGRPLLIEGRSYGAYDLFYEGTGWFNALVGCNVWTAAALRVAGLRTGWWNPLPGSLIWSLRLHNQSSAAQVLSVARSQP